MARTDFTDDAPDSSRVVTAALVSGWFTTLVWLGFGVWLLLRPDDLLASFDAVSTPALRTEIRGFYGGLELGIAATLAVLLTTRRREAASRRCLRG